MPPIDGQPIPLRKKISRFYSMERSDIMSHLYKKSFFKFPINLFLTDTTKVTPANYKNKKSGFRCFLAHPALAPFGEQGLIEPYFIKADFFPIVPPTSTKNKSKTIGKKSH
jgi:hypothetical protein